MSDKVAATFHPFPAPGTDEPGESVPTLDELDNMLTDAAGLLDRASQHLFSMRHGVTLPQTAYLTQDQVQLAWATTKNAQVLLRDLIALTVPEA